MRSLLPILAGFGLLIILPGVGVNGASAIERPTGAVVLDTSGTQTRVGKVTLVRVSAGQTRFRVDSCPATRLPASFFVIDAANPDKLDITRLLVAALIFDREVKLYNADYGEDIDYCPGSGLAAGSVTVGTVRVQD
jgi:hypothetical protein